MHDLVIPPPAEAVGIVLAGGRSRRLATVEPGPGGKAAIVVAGESLLARICRVVATVVPRVIVVAAPEQPLPALPTDVEIVGDSSPGAGPTSGLCDGLRHAAQTAAGRPRLAFVTACDAPLLSPAVVRLLLHMARGPDVRMVVPVVGGHPQVLVSVVALDLVGVFTDVAAEGGGLRTAVERLRACEPTAVRLVTAAEVAEVDPGLESFFDVDTPADLAWLEARGIPSSRG
jgi:molybdopterin-guanine dinucleotide biosynthesis protein A